jgi:hypothetical protein
MGRKVISFMICKVIFLTANFKLVTVWGIKKKVEILKAILFGIAEEYKGA